MKPLKIVVFLMFVGLTALQPALIGKVGSQALPDAPTGFDNQTNGLTDQAIFAADTKTFEERDVIEDGLGPVYNAQACVECHQSPVTGGGSQISVLRAGHRDAQGNFVEAPGGSLINDRAIHASLQEYVPSTETIRTFRASLSILGDGFVEAIDDETLIEIARNQPRLSGGAIAGQVIRVPLLEAPGQTRVGRFGWKNQQASLLSFSADAYLNEIGITSRLLPEENTSLGRLVTAFDTVADPEDTDNDIDVFARFMRGTKAPSIDVAAANSPDGRAGAQIFNQIGCAICHVTAIPTARPGTVINGGAFIVPPALGGKIIRPFGDFLLHDVGTGDGIVQNGGPETANKLRTAPLWGLRARNRYMHDAASLTLEDAIRRHRGEATGTSSRFNQLTERQRTQLVRFLRSL